MTISNINTICLDMPSRIRSYVVKNPDGSYTIVLNSRLTRENNIIAFHHELQHILNGDYEKNLTADEIELQTHDLD